MGLAMKQEQRAGGCSQHPLFLCVCVCVLRSLSKISLKRPWVPW